MKHLEIYLKSGHTIKIECEEWKFTCDKATLEYIGYEFKGIKSPETVGICPDQIAGFIVLN